jgi:hypothetical protein
MGGTTAYGRRHKGVSEKPTAQQLGKYSGYSCQHGRLCTVLGSREYLLNKLVN